MKKSIKYVVKGLFTAATSTSMTAAVSQTIDTANISLSQEYDEIKALNTKGVTASWDKIREGYLEVYNSLSEIGKKNMYLNILIAAEEGTDKPWSLQDNDIIYLSAKDPSVTSGSPIFKDGKEWSVTVPEDIPDVKDRTLFGRYRSNVPGVYSQVEVIIDGYIEAEDQPVPNEPLLKNLLQGLVVNLDPDLRFNYSYDDVYRHLGCMLINKGKIIREPEGHWVPDIKVRFANLMNLNEGTISIGSSTAFNDIGFEGEFRNEGIIESFNPGNSGFHFQQAQTTINKGLLRARGSGLKGSERFRTLVLVETALHNEGRIELIKGDNIEIKSIAGEIRNGSDSKEASIELRSHQAAVRVLADKGEVEGQGNIINKGKIIVHAHEEIIIDAQNGLWANESANSNIYLNAIGPVSASSMSVDGDGAGWVNHGIIHTRGQQIRMIDKSCELEGEKETGWINEGTMILGANKEKPIVIGSQYLNAENNGNIIVQKGNLTLISESFKNKGVIYLHKDSRISLLSKEGLYESTQRADTSKHEELITSINIEQGKVFTFDSIELPIALYEGSESAANITQTWLNTRLKGILEIGSKQSES